MNTSTSSHANPQVNPQTIQQATLPTTPPATPSAHRPFAAYPSAATMAVADKPARVFTHGHGSWLFDSEGRRYLDCVQGWAVNTLGHAPAEITRALQAQSGRLLQAGPGFHNDQAIALSNRLAQLSGLARCFVTTSGAEANEGAIKLARKYGQVRKGGAFETITFANSFHGRTLATMSASGKPGFDTLFAPQVPGFPKARLNDIDSVKALITPHTVAILVEPIQGEAGVIEATPAFLQALRALCDAEGLLLMLDEVQTGVGRTGQLWGHTSSGITPDVMTLGKGLGGGAPIGALLARDEVCCFQPGDQGGTYNGNALMCAVALAVLDSVTAPGFLAGVRARGAQLRSGLEAISQQMWKGTGPLGSGTVRGQGLLLALDLPPSVSAGALAQQGLERARAGSVPDVDGDAAQATPGLLINPVRPHCVRWIPALNISAAEIDQALDLFGQVLTAHNEPTPRRT